MMSPELPDADSGLTGGRARKRRAHGFSLLELLVVLGVIGILAAVSLPALRGMGQSQSIDSAAQQLVDDLALARARAINGRTTVHVVFVPPNIATLNAGSSTAAINTQRRLADDAFRSYGFFAERTVGDQPGRPAFRYLEDWQTLPDGVLVAQSEFAADTYANWLSANPTNRPLGVVAIPFPTANSPTNLVPHVAFSPEGGLVDSMGNPIFGAEFIELARGSVLAQRDDAGNLIFYDVKEFPSETGAATRVRIDGFTGRAQVVQPEIQP